MSVHKRTGFLSPNRISEMVWDSEIEEAGASTDYVIYLGNGFFGTFRQALKYLWFSFSFLDEIRKYYVETRFLLVKDILEMQVGRLRQHSTKFGQSRFVTATQPKCRV